MTRKLPPSTRPLRNLTPFLQPVALSALFVLAAAGISFGCADDPNTSGGEACKGAAAGAPSAGSGNPGTAGSAPGTAGANTTGGTTGTAGAPGTAGAAPTA